MLGDSTFEMLAYPIETILAEKIVTAIARGETNTRERDWADMWRLTGSHDLAAATLAAALKRTAEHRGVTLQPLTRRIGDLVRLRSGPYRAWRQRQGADALAYPTDLETIIKEVVTFADELFAEPTTVRSWVGFNPPVGVLTGKCCNLAPPLAR